ncbi:histidine phosphatase family protein [Fodinicola acaciae]|uniref:histidine phosphatase family protein n=1 Tax=Fodinicola acaciae TaxID=2681555 RepID=UPI001C9E71FB|nr:histidine phosphatase family protein [Fodinicola acaciae]
MTLLTLVRHGQTIWHADNRYAGSSDVDLTATGLAQAEALGEWAAVAKPDAIACSPLTRSRLTAAPAARILGLEPDIHDDLREVHFGEAEGRTLAELPPEIADAFVRDPVASPFPGAETISDAAERMRHCLLSLAERHRGEHVLVVGHNTAIRLALCRVLGIELSAYRRLLRGPDNVSRTDLLVTDRMFRLERFNAPLVAEGRTF